MRSRLLVLLAVSMLLFAAIIVTIVGRAVAAPLGIDSPPASP
jgi:hypothetical protein